MNPGTFAGISNPGLALAASVGNRIEQMIAASMTWTAPITGDYLIFAVGAGGSGAASAPSGATRTSGAGAGGLAIRRVRLNAGA
ncbi:MAG: hypothetical protein ACK55I_02050, partial [bacterium]